MIQPDTSAPPRGFAIALDFTPAPSATNRHDGWSERQQRRFVAVLAATGVVATAAKAIGMGTSSAYALRRRPGAEDFARAWDAALDEARDRAFDIAVDRAMNGVTAPRHYRGRFTGMMHRYDHRAVMAALRHPPAAAGARNLHEADEADEADDLQK